MQAIEFNWLRSIDYFPPRQESWGNLKSICIATKNRTIGDTLVLTPLPRKLKEKYPKLKIYTYVRGFNPAAFHLNPYVDGVKRLPERIYGDDANWGTGHLICQKEGFFGLDVDSLPKPELYVSEAEKKWIQRKLEFHLLAENARKPLCLLHPWGGTHSSVGTHAFWDEIVSRWKGKVRFWQIGVHHHSAIQGCEYYFFTSRKFWDARKLFSLFSQADLFLGVDSGPMHIARAFDLPSMILADHFTVTERSELFKIRDQQTYFQKGVLPMGFLYQDQDHYFWKEGSLERERERILSEVDRFFSARTAHFEAASKR